jgi:Flp pilus assembly protein TadG
MALMALALPALIGGIGLASDVGNFYYNDYKMQTAVDAAAIAGAMCLPSQSMCTATTTSTNYAKTNGLSASEITVTDPSYNSTTCPSGGAYQPCQMKVAATRTVRYYFSRLVGVTSGTLNVSATAAGGTITTITSQDTEQGGVSGMMPIGLQWNSPWKNGNSVTLIYNSNLSAKCPSSIGGSAPGNWDWLSLGGTGESNLETNVTNGYKGKISIGDSVPSQTGAGQPVFGKMKTRIGGGSCSYGCACNSPCAISVILTDWTGVTGSKPVPVKGFAEMCVDSVTKVGSCSQLVAHAITCPVSGGSWTTTSSSTSTYQEGALAVKPFQ